MTAPLKVAVAGLGTVGGALVRILSERRAGLAERCGRAIEIVAVSARDRAKSRGVDLGGIPWHADARALARTDADVVVELVGGAEGPGADLVRAALEAGKSVVTANKALLAEHGVALARLAEERGLHLRYEAAVAGGIPIIKALREGLVANRILSVQGILNGTSNFILSRMEETGASFAAALAEAQSLGLAEADPTFDVDGTDAAHKLAILASLAFGVVPDPAAVHKDGIAGITELDIRSARDLGYSVKLLARAERREDGVLQRVHPALVPHASPLSHVTGAENAVTVEGDAVGRAVLQGEGAGGGPTASAVLADLADIARGLPAGPVFGLPAGRLAPARALALAEREGAYYLRLKVMDRPKVMAAVADILGEAEVSIDEIRQPHHLPSEPVSIVLTTHRAQEAVMDAAVARLAAHPALTSAPRLVRIEE
ncbi:MAG: homoserine dehydrogenase [Alphaproteobacteria bacterium]|nr:homoserine dehydrogenase [Alphaproteobacteria bacterium]